MEVAGRQARLGGDHPVRCGDEVVPGDRLHDLAEVDHERVGDHGHVDPVTVGVLHLEPGRGAGGENGEEPGVVMGVDAGSAGRRGRVGDELGERHRFVAEVVRQVFRCQPERLGEEAQHTVGERAQLAEPGEDQLAVARQHRVGEPLVRAEQPEVRRLDVAVARGPLGPQIDLLADVRTVVGRLGPDRFPPSKMARVALVDAQLVGLGQGEERPHRVEHGPDERRIDPVVRDDEEPDLVADLADLVGERRTPVDRRQVDDRDLGELPGRHLLDPTTRLVTLSRPTPATNGRIQRSARWRCRRSTRRPQLASVWAIQSAAGRREPATTR